MNTNLTLSEILTIAVVILIVFGPQRLPEMARRAGALVAKLREAAGTLRTEFTQEFEDVAQPLKDIEADLMAAKADLRGAIPDMSGLEQDMAADSPSDDSVEAAPDVEEIRKSDEVGTDDAA